MRLLVPVIIACITCSSNSQAQDLNTPRFNGDRAMVIESISPRSETGFIPAVPDADKAYDLPAPLEDTFKLHSNPDATKVIYLDFDGHMIMWEGEEFYYEPWNMEGPNTTFSETERTIIQLTWQSIAEDFLPFELDVTTEDPGVEALMNTGGEDEAWGIRAVINHITDTYSWAYNDSFNDSEDTELYAWTGSDSSIEETWVWTADSVSHEAGHALGLSHDGTRAGVEYYSGHGAGDIAWSSIMGWTNYGLSQWSQGEYTDANNQEDDLGILTTQNGFGYRPDDHGSTTATATNVKLYQSSVAEGIIEQADDIDFFAFTMAGKGTMKVTVSPDNLAPNLDIDARLFDSEGTLLISANPPTALYAEIEMSLSAGDYYLSVDGTGYDDPESDGYSDYGTLGYYSIEVSVDQDSDEVGDSGDVEDVEDVGGGACGCTTANPAWPSMSLFLGLCLFLVGRRQAGT
jgi:hypothetical protein